MINELIVCKIIIMIMEITDVIKCTIVYIIGLLLLQNGRWYFKSCIKLYEKNIKGQILN